MPKAAYYSATEIWNKIIEILLTDDYLLGTSGIFTNTRDTTKKDLYYLPLDAVTIKNYPAMAIVFDGTETIADNVSITYEEHFINIRFQVAAQNSNLKEAITNSINYLEDIKKTIQQVITSGIGFSPNGAGRLATNYSFTGIRPYNTFLPDSKSLWTSIHELTMNIRFEDQAYQ